MGLPFFDVLNLENRWSNVFLKNVVLKPQMLAVLNVVPSFEFLRESSFIKLQMNCTKFRKTWTPFCSQFSFSLSSNLPQFYILFRCRVLLI